MTEDPPGEWRGDVAIADLQQVERAPGGALSDAARDAAIESTLGLLGLYFAAGEQELVDRAAGSREERRGELEALVAGLRLRVALAASGRLTEIVHRIASTPTFRYELRSVEQVGALSGALDVNRWATRPRGGNAELAFPVLEVQRGSRTPENTLASYAMRWVLVELKSSLSSSIASSASVEHHAVRRHGDRLTRLLQLPLFASTAREVQDIRTRQALLRLIGQVRRRLQRREVSHPSPYRELLSWIEESLAGIPAVNSGDVSLALYDGRFDNKLFELWCLRMLGREIARALNLPERQVSERWRRGEPAYSFENFAGRIDVFFQRSIPVIAPSQGARWTTGDGVRLGGVPDIVVRVRPLKGAERLVVLDPKLRQRDRLPAEELYKVLGYLQNYDVAPAIGGVFIYTTEHDLKPPVVFSDGLGGTLLAVTLNPTASAEANATAMRPVVTALLQLIDVEAMPVAAEGAGEGDEELVGENMISSARRTLLTWGSGHMSEIQPSRERVLALIGEDRWARLDDDVQIMMATADLVGHQLDAGADFSGPVIGMCASIEHILHGHLLGPVTAGHPELERQARTFGAAIDAVEHAVEGRGGALANQLRAWIDEAGIDVDRVHDLIPQWRRLNSAFRIPAAHRELLTRHHWQGVYRLVVGAEGLLASTLDACEGPT